MEIKRDESDKFKLTFKKKEETSIEEICELSLKISKSLSALPPDWEHSHEKIKELMEDITHLKKVRTSIIIPPEYLEFVNEDRGSAKEYFGTIQDLYTCVEKEVRGKIDCLKLFRSLLLESIKEQNG
jgi:hypothetical protein